MLALQRRRREMGLTGVGFVFRRGLGFYAALAAIIADIGDVPVDRDVLHIDVADRHIAEIVDRAIVEEDAMLPTAAFVPFSGIAVAVVDAAIEADARSPIAGMEDIGAGDPGPVARRPEQARPRRLDPGAGHPVIIAVIRVPQI